MNAHLENSKNLCSILIEKCFATILFVKMLENMIIEKIIRVVRIFTGSSLGIIGRKLMKLAIIIAIIMLTISLLVIFSGIGFWGFLLDGGEKWGFMFCGGNLGI